MTRHLTPPQFQCGTHLTDLTDYVVDAVDTLFPVTSIGSSLQDASGESDFNTFRVIVVCPGEDTGSQHPLVFHGTIG